MRWWDLVCVSTRERSQFPSVLLQPLGHLSVCLESAVYRLVAEPANPNCDTDCDRPPNVPRSLTGIRPARRPKPPVATVRLRPSSIERSGALRFGWDPELRRPC